MSRFPNRRWLVLPTSITGSINFNEVHESSVDNLRYSVDGSQTFVKYEVNEVTESYETYIEDFENEGTWITSSIEAGVYGRPSFYSSSYNEYNHADILALLATDAWMADPETSGSGE